MAVNQADNHILEVLTWLERMLQEEFSPVDLVKKVKPDISEKIRLSMKFLLEWRYHALESTRNWGSQQVAQLDVLIEHLHIIHPVEFASVEQIRATVAIFNQSVLVQKMREAIPAPE